MGNRPPPQPPKKNRTGLVVVVIVGLVVLLGGGVVTLAAMMLSPGTETSNGARPPLAEPPITPGSGPVPRYGDAQAPNACSLIPVDALQNKGWTLSREFVITERLPDPAARVIRPVGDDAGGVVHGLSGCSIQFDGHAHVDLSIQRAPHDEPSGIASDLRLAREDTQPYQEGGWEVLIDPETDDQPNLAAALLWNGAELVELEAWSPEGTRQQQAMSTGKLVISSIISGWDRSFIPANVAKYPAPYGAVPDPCEVIKAEDVTELFGAPSSGMIGRDWSPAAIRLQRMDTLEWFEYVESTCFRNKQVADDYTDSASINITLRTFPDEQKAAVDFQYFADPSSEMGRNFGPPVPLNETIGDSPGYISPAFAKERSIMFRVGRYFVSLSAEEAAVLLDDQAMRTRLVPIAHKVADRSDDGKADFPNQHMSPGHGRMRPNG